MESRSLFPENIIEKTGDFSTLGGYPLPSISQVKMKSQPEETSKLSHPPKEGFWELCGVGVESMALLVEPA